MPLMVKFSALGKFFLPQLWATLHWTFQSLASLHNLMSSENCIVILLNNKISTCLWSAPFFFFPPFFFSFFFQLIAIWRKIGVGSEHFISVWSRKVLSTPYSDFPGEMCPGFRWGSRLAYFRILIWNCTLFIFKSTVTLCWEKHNCSKCR